MNKFKSQLKLLKDKQNISSLIDIIRGLAIIFVIIVHLRNSIGYTGGFDFLIGSGFEWIVTSFLDFGNAGVALFFFISGFLLNYLYNQKLNLKSFTIKRIARIFPAWVFWSLIALLVAHFGLKWNFDNADVIMKNVYGGVIPITDIESLTMFIASIFMLGWLYQNVWNSYVPGGWSIQAEVAHYAVFPIINKLKTTMLLLLITLVQLLGYSLPLEENKILAAFITSPAFFLLGIVASRGIRNYSLDKKAYSTPELIFILLALISTAGLSGPFVSQWVSLITLFVAIILAVVLSNYKGFNNLLKHIGKYSYGMYFSHFLIVVPIGYLASIIVIHYSLGASGWLIALAAFLVTTYLSLMISKLTYNTFEKKFIERANKYKAANNEK